MKKLYSKLWCSISSIDIIKIFLDICATMTGGETKMKTNLIRFKFCIKKFKSDKCLPKKNRKMKVKM